MASKIIIKYDFQNFQENVKYIAKLYEDIKRKLDIKEKIPYLKIEDETAIEPRPEYDPRLNIVWRYCGLKEAHLCEDFYAINVSDDQWAYEQLVEDMNNSKLATMARTIMVNPLHTSLPRIVLHLQATCNTFTHETVLLQWNMYDLLCKEFLDPVLGPGIGNSSDGDSRRRKLFLVLSSDANNGQRFKPVPISEGFLFSAKLEVDERNELQLRNLSDSDFIHNHKKLDNHLDYVSRDLRPGLYPAHRNDIRAVLEHFSPHEHGLRDEDVKKRDRQNWASAQRTTFPKLRRCLEDLIEGRNANGIRDPTLRGTSIYLELVFYYMEIFISLEASLYERIRYAGAVTIFMGIWRNYVVMRAGLTLKDNFLTR